jgi:carbon-monoxide dehydrogenase large subunit
VLAVLTGADMVAAGVGNIGRHPPIVGRGSRKLVLPNRPALARERVMHVGEAVAMVIAETALAAQDAAELVGVQYDETTPVIDVLDAVRPDAPQLWPEAPGNIAVDWAGPAPDPDANARAVDDIFKGAKHVARLTLRNQRLVVAAMEPRGVTASYDAASDRTTLRICSQSAGAMRDNILGIMNWPKGRLRVITEDVGGAFGLKTGAYPDYLAVMVGARMVGQANPREFQGVLSFQTTLPMDSGLKMPKSWRRLPTPVPLAYSKPRLNCASACPCSAALRNHWTV